MTTPREEFLASALGADRPTLERALDRYRDALLEILAHSFEIAGSMGAALGKEPDGLEAELTQRIYDDCADMARTLKSTAADAPQQAPEEFCGTDVPHLEHLWGGSGVPVHHCPGTHASVSEFLASREPEPPEEG